MGGAEEEEEEILEEDTALISDVTVDPDPNSKLDSAGSRGDSAKARATLAEVAVTEETLAAEEVTAADTAAEVTVADNAAVVTVADTAAVVTAIQPQPRASVDISSASTAEAGVVGALSVAEVAAVATTVTVPSVEASAAEAVGRVQRHSADGILDLLGELPDFPDDEDGDDEDGGEEADVGHDYSGEAIEDDNVDGDVGSAIEGAEAVQPLALSPSSAALTDLQPLMPPPAAARAAWDVDLLTSRGTSCATARPATEGLAADDGPAADTFHIPANAAGAAGSAVDLGNVEEASSFTRQQTPPIPLAPEKISRVLEDLTPKEDPPGAAGVAAAAMMAQAAGTSPGEAPDGPRDGAVNLELKTNQSPRPSGRDNGAPPIASPHPVASITVPYETKAFVGQPVASLSTASVPAEAKPVVGQPVASSSTASVPAEAKADRTEEAGGKPVQQQLQHDEQHLQQRKQLDDPAGQAALHQQVGRGGRATARGAGSSGGGGGGILACLPCFAPKAS